MSVNNIKQLIHPNTLNYYSIPENASIYKISPLDLLNHRRFDVMARYIYAQAYINKLDMVWPQSVYEMLFRAWTNDFKPPLKADPGKESMQDYLDQFNSLISNMQENGLSNDVSLIPTCQGTIIDGAHRLATALALGLSEVSCVELVGAPQEQTYRSLQKIGIEENVLWEMLRQFIGLKKNIRMAVLFPNVAKHHDRIEGDLAKSFTVTHSIDHILTLNGLRNLMSLLYGHHEWWSEDHAKSFAHKRYKIMKDTRFVFFEELDPLSTRQVKDTIRETLNTGKDSFHTTDTHEETRTVSDLILNENGVRWMNWAYQLETPVYDQLCNDVEKLTLSSLEKERFCVDSGSVLALHGLRDTRDFDVVTDSPELLEFYPVLENHNQEYNKTSHKISDILYSPQNYFYFKGIKYVSLPVLKDMKKTRSDLKDKRDILLIDKLLCRHKTSLSNSLQMMFMTLRWGSRRFKRGVYKKIVPYIKEIVPERYYEKVKFFKRTILRIK